MKLLNNFKNFSLKELEGHFSKYVSYYIFFVILFTLSPFGSLSGNEEMYYGLAKKFLDNSWNGEFSSFDYTGNYRFISDFLIGSMISLLGFKCTQIVGSIISSFILTHCFVLLLRSINLLKLEGLIGIILFILLGQSLIGREWLFEDFEAKVFAYYFVIISLNFYVKNNLKYSLFFISIATYFHLLVGFFWFFIILLSLYDLRSLIFLKKIIKYAISYLFLTSPIMITASFGFIGSDFIQDPKLPTPDYIYSYIRQFKMVLPFYNFSSFYISWLPGIIAHLSVLLCILIIHLSKNSNQNKLFKLIISANLILFTFLIISFFDTDGFFGKFYPFRISSLLFLLSIFFLISSFKKLVERNSFIISFICIILISPFFLMQNLIASSYDIKNAFFHDSTKVGLYEFINITAEKNELVLIDEEIEEKFFDFERSLNLPTLQTFKFVPSSKEALTKWYLKREFKKNIFNGSVRDYPSYDYSYLLSSLNKKELLSKNHEVIFENKKYVFLRIYN